MQHEGVWMSSKGPCPLSRFVPRPSCLTGVVGQGQSQPSVGREGTNRVCWPVSKKPMSTKPVFLTSVRLPLDVRQEKRLSGHGPLGVTSVGSTERHSWLSKGPTKLWLPV